MKTSLKSKVKKFEKRINKNNENSISEFDKIHTMILEKITEKDLDVLLDFKLENRWEWEKENIVYQKYCTEDEMKIILEYQKQSEKEYINSCTRKRIKEHFVYIDDETVEKLYTLTKQGKLKEVSAMEKDIYNSLTEEEIDNLLRPYL